jgi:ubiquitin-like 1-activating enzyme E1 A
MTSDTTTTTTTTSTTKKATTPSESDVYDRQIRLWGAESQAKMQQASVLYIHVTGVTAEVLKNLVLAGISATLCDPRPTSVMAPHFFSPSKANNNQTKKMKYASVAHAVQPLVEELNFLLGACPIIMEGKSVQDLTAEDLKPFTVILASQLPLKEAVRLSKLANDLGSQFYMGDCFGMHGACMMDLGADLQYRPEQGKQLLDPVPLKTYVPLHELVNVPLHQCINRFHKKAPPSVYIQYRCMLECQEKTGHWPCSSSSSSSEDDETNTLDETIWKDFLKDQQVELSSECLTALGQAGMAQVAPVCAVLGGMLGNEIIKVVSGKGEPANNTLLLDGNLCKTWTFLVQPKPQT